MTNITTKESIDTKVSPPPTTPLSKDTTGPSAGSAVAIRKAKAGKATGSK
jgi:hypothetical protein